MKPFALAQVLVWARVVNIIITGTGVQDRSTNSKDLQPCSDFQGLSYSLTSDGWSELLCKTPFVLLTEQS
jgi:hypothetical protein